MKSIEVQLQEALAKTAALEADKKSLEERIAEAEKTSAKTYLTGIMKEAKLPEVAQNRLFKAFENATKTEGMKEAVSAEAQYIATLGGAKRNNGAHQQETAVSESVTLDSLKERQYQQARKSGLSEAEANLVAGFAKDKKH